jgi:hypothetical protein
MKHIKKVTIYDFDGTLAFTPTPETGKEIWNIKTGEKWPYDGWWGKLESMNTSVFYIPLNPKVVDSLKNDILDEQTYTVLMTGRISKFKDVVLEIMDGYDIPPLDEYLFNNMSSTLKFKIHHMNRLLNTFPNIEIFEMWDDRHDHILEFRKWANDNIKTEFVMNVCD